MSTSRPSLSSLNTHNLSMFVVNSIMMIFSFCVLLTFKSKCNSKVNVLGWVVRRRVIMVSGLLRDISIVNVLSRR